MQVFQNTTTTRKQLQENIQMENVQPISNLIVVVSVFMSLYIYLYTHTPLQHTARAHSQLTEDNNKQENIRWETNAWNQIKLNKHVCIHTDTLAHNLPTVL